MKKICLFAIVTILCVFSVIAQHTPFTFIHISDLHVSTVSSSVNACDLNGEEAKCYLQQFKEMNPKPAFVLATGDISNIGNSSANPDGMYSALTQFLYPSSLLNPGIGALHIDSAQTIPIYFTPGNHDYYTTLLPPGTLTQLNTLPNYAKFIAPDSDYAVTTDISVILFVRSGYDISYLISVDPKGSGLTNEQCDWIRTELSLNSNKRKIIVMHHPTANHTGVNCDGSTHSSIANSSTASFYVNRTTFLNICDSNHVDVVLAGHSHQSIVVDEQGNEIGENCTTCGTRFVQTGPAFAGCYRLITVDSAFVSVGQSLVANCTTTNIAELDRDIDISVYPNPSTGIFNLNIGQYLPFKIKVFNVMGECVYQQNSMASQLQIDMQSQSNGIYFLQLTVGEGEKDIYKFSTPLIINK